jgi:hypothetical protein
MEKRRFPIRWPGLLRFLGVGGGRDELGAAHSWAICLTNGFNYRPHIPWGGGSRGGYRVDRAFVHREDVLCKVLWYEDGGLAVSRELAASISENHLASVMV